MDVPLVVSGPVAWAAPVVAAFLAGTLGGCLEAIEWPRASAARVALVVYAVIATTGQAMVHGSSAGAQILALIVTLPVLPLMALPWWLVRFFLRRHP